MTDWLADDHLVWFVLDVVAELDTARLHERAARRRDGRPVRNTAGRAGYDPDMLLALLVYGYACGERSSRRIERLCATDVAFRVLCAGDTPDHTVLARFRQVQQSAEPQTRGPRLVSHQLPVRLQCVHEPINSSGSHSRRTNRPTTSQPSPVRPHSATLHFGGASGFPGHRGTPTPHSPHATNPPDQGRWSQWEAIWLRQPELSG
ncbi:MAG: transposase [Pseudonocardiaceae bacterium]